MTKAIEKHDALEVGEPVGGKVFYFEWARCLAAAMVVLIHVTSGIMDNYSVAEVGTGRALVWSELQIVVMRWAVPIFLMITGALLLNPEKQIGWAKVWKYVKRMVYVLCTFGFAFCLMKELFVYRALTLEMLWQAVLDLLSNDGFSHMWYIYALIGVYLLLPLFKSFVASHDKRELEILLLILFTFTCVIPTINSVFGLNLATFVWFSSSVFYVFMGYYAHNFMELNHRILCVGLVALALNMGLKAWGIVGYGEYWKFLHGPGCFMEALWSITVFLLMKRYLDRPYKARGGVATISRLSFGIYIIHPLFLNILYKGLGWGPWMLPPVIFELVIWAIAFMGSVAFVWLCKKIPWVRTFI